MHVKFQSIEKCCNLVSLSLVVIQQLPISLLVLLGSVSQFLAHERACRQVALVLVGNQSKVNFFVLLPVDRQ